MLLYNYLKADGQEGVPKDFYPNSKDEIFFVEHEIGYIRSVFDFVADKQVVKVQKELVPKKAPDAPPPKPKEGDEEEEDNEDEDDEENKKKFNPDEYAWFKTEGKPMSFPQFFTQMRPTQKVFKKALTSLRLLTCTPMTTSATLKRPSRTSITRWRRVRTLIPMPKEFHLSRLMSPQRRRR